MNITEQRIHNNKLKRRQEVQKQIIILLFTFCVILILAVTLGSTFAKAKDFKSDAPDYKYFTSILIETGDSLYSIALENMSTHYNSVDAYMNEVKHINSLDEKMSIHVGQYIIIPYYSRNFVG